MKISEIENIIKNTKFHFKKYHDFSGNNDRYRVVSNILEYGYNENPYYCLVTDDKKDKWKAVRIYSDVSPDKDTRCTRCEDVSLEEAIAACEEDIKRTQKQPMSMKIHREDEDVQITLKKNKQEITLNKSDMDNVVTAYNLRVAAIEDVKGYVQSLIKDGVLPAEAADNRLFISTLTDEYIDIQKLKLSKPDCLKESLETVKYERFQPKKTIERE